MEPNDLIAQARAKIVWGERSRSVRNFLTSNGIAESEADATVKELCAERYAEIRGIGLQRTVFGVVILAASSILIFYCVGGVDLDKVDYFEMKARIGFAVVGGFGGLYGVSKIIDGVVCIFRAKSNDESLSDMQT